MSDKDTPNKGNWRPWPQDWHPDADADDVAEAIERDKRRRKRKPKPRKPRRRWFSDKA